MWRQVRSEVDSYAAAMRGAPSLAVAMARARSGLSSSLIDCRIRKISSASGRASVGATNAMLSDQRASYEMGAGWPTDKQIT